MASLNRVFMMGNITRDPELRYTPGGQAVTTLGLAVNSKWGTGDEKKEEVLFIDVNVWGKTAENCVTYLKKGAPVFVEGRLRSRSWDDKESGQKRSKMEITATTVQFLPKGGGAGGGPAAGTRPSPEHDVGEMPPQDDDVPF